MITIHARNVHQALPQGVHLLQHAGIRRPSRGGKTVIEHPDPVATVYRCPTERVLFWPERDANPFFHFFESLHMLAGRQDVGWLIPFNRRMGDFSDDGVMLHGAYGHRWRYAFSAWGHTDQLKTLVKLLQADPDSRRAVLQMWHAPLDLNIASKDIPCNTHAYFKIRDGALRMTVCCRSNDMIWGAYGANAVHFSFLQEYLADKLEVQVGPFTQISDSFHAYEGVWEPVKNLVERPCPYVLGEVTPYPFKASSKEWDQDLSTLVVQPAGPYRTLFFDQVVLPLYVAHAAYRTKNVSWALDLVQACAATDWRRAAEEWLKRRPSYRS